jgi:hypothetical protein
VSIESLQVRKESVEDDSRFRSDVVAGGACYVENKVRHLVSKERKHPLDEIQVTLHIERVRTGWKEYPTIV